MPKFMYEDCFNMTAVCLDDSNVEVRYPLQAKEGEESLHYEPKPGVWQKTNVPKFMLDAVKKRPATLTTSKGDEGDEDEEHHHKDETKGGKKKRKRRKRAEASETKFEAKFEAETEQEAGTKEASVE